MVSFSDLAGQGSRELADALQQSPWFLAVRSGARGLVQSMVAVGREHGQVGDRLVQEARSLFGQFEEHTQGSVDRELLLSCVHEIFEEELEGAFGSPDSEASSSCPDSPEEKLRAEIECHLMESWQFTPADCFWSYA